MIPQKVIYILHMMPKSVRIFSLFLVNDAWLRSNLKTLCFMFHQGFQTLETIKALGLWPHAFINFLVFGNLNETLALVFEILHLLQWVIGNTHLFLSYFFVKKIPLSRRVEYVADGSMDQSVSQWVRDVCMSHQSDHIYYKQPIKFLVLKVNGTWEDLIPIQFRTTIFILL